MSDTGTSPSRELWLLDTDSWLHDARGARWGTWGLGGWEEGGVEGKWWEEWGDAGRMGVNAEAGGRADVFGAEVRSVDCATGWETGEERVEDWAAVGEVSGLVDGRMDEVSVEDDWHADWAAEEEDAKEGGRVVEEYAGDVLIAGEVDEAMTWGWRSGDRWLGDVMSVSCVSSVLFGILLYEKQRTQLKYCYTGSWGRYASTALLDMCIPELHLHCYGVLLFPMNSNFLWPESAQEDTRCDISRGGTELTVQCFDSILSF